MSLILARIVSMILAAMLSVSSAFAPVTAVLQSTGTSAAAVQEERVNDYPFVMVHGFAGWGSYEFYDKYFPYWGMGTRDLFDYLDGQGFECYAASVNPYSSAWDRACELYAQLTGTVVDYGEAHSKKFGHDRYGTSYVGKALIDNWDEVSKINLVGHSFGGTTCRLLIDLLADGSDEEKSVTPEGELSGLFKGGMSDWVYSLTTLAAPHNGTTAIGYLENGEFQDVAFYDMSINGAEQLNENIEIQKDIYYFSYPGCKTELDESTGNQVPQSNMVFMYKITSKYMGDKALNAERSGGRLDDSWLQNDGMVNTISATAPFDELSVTFDAGNIQKGTWNVMPTQNYDHLSFTGSFFNMDSDAIKGFYLEFLSIVGSV